MIPHCIMIFSSIHDVTAAERALNKKDIWCDMVPTPRDLSSNCGMALEVLHEDLLMIEEAFADTPIVLKEIHIEEGFGYRRLDKGDH